MRDPSWKDGPDYIDEPQWLQENRAGTILEAPRDPDDDTKCLFCDMDAYDGLLCIDCLDEQLGRVYVSNSIGFMDFSRQVNELVEVG